MEICETLTRSSIGTPAISIVYYAPENFLLLTGNPAAFRTTYGAGSVVVRPHMLLFMRELLTNLRSQTLTFVEA